MAEEAQGAGMSILETPTADGNSHRQSEVDDVSATNAHNGKAEVPLHPRNGPSVEHKKPISLKALDRMREKVKRSGIVYMSRIPPHLKPLKLRQMVEVHAKLGRIYMAPRDRSAPGKGTHFCEAWIEFEDKKMAKAVAELLNGHPMGGKKRSKYHDELWTLKYLPKFKWDHLTEEVGMTRTPALQQCCPVPR
jgi:ESF2/ABP1 family protein